MHAEANQSKRMGTPEDSVCLIGSVYDGGTIRFTQLDPEFEPVYYHRSRGYILIEDAEPGSYLKVTTFVHEEPFVTTTYYIGFSGRTSLDMRVPTKPGLYYLGYLDLSEIKKNELIFLPASKQYKESTFLKYLLPSVKNKAWVPVIENKIKELEDAGK